MAPVARGVGWAEMPVDSMTGPNAEQHYDWLWALIADLPPEQITAAGLGYALRGAEAARDRERRRGQAGKDVYAAAGPHPFQPSYTELQVRRGEL